MVTIVNNFLKSGIFVFCIVDLLIFVENKLSIFCLFVNLFYGVLHCRKYTIKIFYIAVWTIILQTIRNMHISHITQTGCNFK